MDASEFNWQSTALSSGDAGTVAANMAAALAAQGISFTGTENIYLPGTISAAVQFATPLAPSAVQASIDAAAGQFGMFASGIPTASFDPYGSSNAAAASGGFLAGANSVFGFTGGYNANPLNDAAVAGNAAANAAKSGLGAIGAAAGNAYQDAVGAISSVNKGLLSDLGAATPIVVGVSVGILALAAAYIYTVHKVA